MAICSIQKEVITRRRQHKFAWIIIIKIFAINLPSQPFLGRHLGLHIFFHDGLLGGAHLFYSWAVFHLKMHDQSKQKLYNYNFSKKLKSYTLQNLQVQQNRSLHSLHAYWYIVFELNCFKVWDKSQLNPT